MTVLCYSRISTEEQLLGVQQTELDAHCLRQGWTIAGKYSDVMSGAKALRPGLADLEARVAGGGIDAVVVVKLDRLGRSVLNVVALIDRLAKAGTAVICISQGIDTRESNPCGRVTYQILAAVSEFERALISERTVAGLANARANGKTLGNVSKKMPKSKTERAAIVQAWLAKNGSYEDLGAALGGVSRATAWRLARKIVPTLAPPPPMEVEI